MPTLSGFPYFEVQFTKDGKVHDDDEVKEIREFLRTNSVTDLLVISHGWNNDMADARKLYTGIFKKVRTGLSDDWVAGVSQRTLAILAILWPSKKFADKELIPTGAAGAGSAVSTAVLRKQVEDLKDIFDSPTADRKLDKAKALIPTLERSPDARREFADILRSLLSVKRSDEEAPKAFLTLDGDVLLTRLAQPIVEDNESEPELGTGGAASNRTRVSEPEGGAAGLFEPLLEGLNAGARRLMNFTTYYEMKERAGTIGSTGVNKVLGQIRRDHPDLNLHLIGHSFGARLVTAAVAGATALSAVNVQSMTLLQAAFSHYGFAENYNQRKDGFFRRVVSDDLVEGPIVISHSIHDKPVGLAYPLASLMANQVASRLGDANDPYGGLGRNGAQKTPEAINESLLLINEGPYQFASGSVYNLKADEIISDHSDIKGDEVAFALISAIGAT